MAVYQNIWSALKAKLDADAAVQAFFTGGVIYGLKDQDLQKFPVLIVSSGDPPVTESWFSLPTRKVGYVKITLYAKVQGYNLATLFLTQYQAIETVLNALDKELRWNGLLQRITLAEAEDAIKISSDGDIVDIKINVILETQPFTAGSR